MPKIALNKSRLLALLASVVAFSFVLSPSLAVTQLVSLQGRVLQGGSPAASGSMAVTIWSDGPDTGSVIYSDNFANAITDGFFDLMLGSASDLNMTYGQLYYLDVSINGQDINWTNPNPAGPQTVNRIQFQSQNGQVPPAFLNPTGNYTFGNATVSNALVINGTLPNATLDVRGGIRLTGGNFTCGLANRGELRYEPGATNTDDRLWWCAKNSTVTPQSYNWVLIARGG